MLQFLALLLLSINGYGLPTLLPTPAFSDDGVTCSKTALHVVTCQLTDIVREYRNVNINITVNACHRPVDVTFKMTGDPRLSWNFTFVPNNQNERVYIPGLYLVPPVPMVPTYLYVREPDEEYRQRNGSTDGVLITVQASLVAELYNMWEEEEFLNHTFHLPHHRTNCLEGLAVQYTDGWITLSLVLSGILAVLCGVLLAFAVRRRLRGRAAPVDQLTLVHNIEQQPRAGTDQQQQQQESVAQMGTQTMHSCTNGQHSASLTKTDGGPEAEPEVGSTGTVEGDCSSATNPHSISVKFRDDATMPVNSNLFTTLKKMKKHIDIGLKGITFEKLKEEGHKRDVRTSVVSVEHSSDGSVVIANPTFLSKTDTGNNKDVKHNSEQFPLDDDLGLKDEGFFITKPGPRSESYSNIYRISNKQIDVNDDWHVRRSEVVGDTALPDGDLHGGGGGIIRRAATNRFGYGSREWLDELEGATAVLSHKRSFKNNTGLKGKRRRGTKKESPRNDNHIKSNDDSGEAISKKAKDVEKARITDKELAGCSDTTHATHNNSGNLNSEHKKNTSPNDRSQRPNSVGNLDAREIVNEVIAKGLFHYEPPIEHAPSVVITQINDRKKDIQKLDNKIEIISNCDPTNDSLSTSNGGKDYSEPNGLKKGGARPKAGKSSTSAS